MFIRKGVFGRKKPAVEEPARRAFGPGDTVFGAELFEGERGDFLRSHGFAPDDPINRLALQEPVAAQLARDQAELRGALAALNGAAAYPIGAFHLLPPVLWRGRFGELLVKRLDMLPCRAWNTIFLPADAAGAADLGLPVLPAQPAEVNEQLDFLVQVVAERFSGATDNAGEAMLHMLASVRSNFPYLFPNDLADFSPAVLEARANMRAVAFLHATLGDVVTKETILRAHEIFLPDRQLLAN